MKLALGCNIYAFDLNPLITIVLIVHAVLKNFESLNQAPPLKDWAEENSPIDHPAVDTM